MLFFVTIFIWAIVSFQLCSADLELFAVVGHAQCSQYLPIGDQIISETGSTDDQYPYYLSTNSASREVEHAYWLQIVTSNGADELFRIYWTFASPKLLTDRFESATSLLGEEVHYLVVDTNTHYRYEYDGFWILKTGSDEAFSAESFGTKSKREILDGLLWGTRGSSRDVLQGFWGIGNLYGDNSTGECGAVYRNGVGSEYPAEGKTYLYLSTEPFDTAMSDTPSVPPQIMPLSAENTLATPLASTRSKIETAGVSDITTSSLTPTGYELFAIVGENSCANLLYYGPSAITTSGSADGYQYYLSTNTAGKNNLHNRWLQLVTDETGAEIFRITWVFSTYKTLANHIINAVTTGEVVSYTVLYDSVTYNFDATWRFSSGSAVSASRFTATSSQCCFSANGGAWGAGTPTVNGINTNYNAQQFWGTGNFGSYDQAQCQYVFVNGQMGFLSGGHTPRSYLYYATDGPQTAAPSASPTTAFPTTSRPTPVPTSSRPTMTPSWRPSAVPTTSVPTYTVTSKPSAVPTMTPTAVPTTTPAPTALPSTATPTCVPTVQPSTTRPPTPVPSTATPSADPSLAPTFAPTTAQPTPVPTAKPSVTPSAVPTFGPTPTPAPSAVPSPVPSAFPSKVPTARPSFEPTPRPTYTPATELFAVVGGTSCAENLYYGPQAITTAGSADGLYPYFLSTSTASRDIAHTTWMQVVTTDGSTEVFRIFWTFDTAKTLADRFIGATTTGEKVSYRVVVASSGAEYSFSGTWWFSSDALISTTTFSTTSTKCCFSADDGVWGAGSGKIDGTSTNTLYSSRFWGVGNWDASDNTAGACRSIYMNAGITYTGAGTKTFMYYSASGSSGETFDLKFQISMLMRPMDYTIYLTKRALYQSIISKTVSSTLTTIAEVDISDFTVTDATSVAASSAVTTNVVSNYLRKMASLVPRRLDTSDNSTARVTCVITLDSSTYTLFEMSTQLQNSIESGSMDAWLHTYANQLQAYELNTTMVVSAATSDLSGASSSGTTANVLTPGIIVAIVLGVIALVIIIGTLIISLARGESPADWLWTGRRRNSRVWIEPPPSDSSSHSESDLPVYPTTATFDMDIDAEIATINQFHTAGITPAVGVLASQDSDLDDFVAQPRQHRRHRNPRGDPRGANEVAWNQTHGRGSGAASASSTPAEMNPLDVVVPRAVIARHQRNAPVVRAHYVDGDIPEAEEASINYGQYGNDVVVAEAFVQNT